MKRAALTYRKEDKIAPYAEALRNVGIEPVLVSPDTVLDSLEGMGLVLSGGTDVDPALYGEAARGETETADCERDAMEQRLLREALQRDLPVLAICRGLQLFNVTQKSGTLLQHLEGHKTPKALHEITVNPGTKLAGIFGAGQRWVNSRHHQAVARVGEGLIVSARAADGTIEALERSDRRFVVAVQWHPEDLFAQERPLFEAFAESL
jgi:putative glutamine amidotransferase